MKLKARKKLSLAKETLTNLQHQDLRNFAVGGSGQITCGLTAGCTALCPTFTCPTVTCPTFFCTQPTYTC
ncbi:MAG TPA: class I lanthipeptide [Thermoanaerobaculia bacterium]|nr:class I lanthipeptide [Thermoanaerobaculia bacterium]